MNRYVALAKKAIKEYVEKGEVISPGEVFDEKRAGCFVSIHRQNGELRGCIGTILPTCKNVQSEIINNAISACQDSRFERIQKDELENLIVSVDILSEPESINSPKSLDVKKYGVIVKAKDGRTGLLLPNLDGVDEVIDQISIARQKAGILENEPIFLFRFKTFRYDES